MLYKIVCTFTLVCLNSYSSDNNFSLRKIAAYQVIKNLSDKNNSYDFKNIPEELQKYVSKIAAQIATSLYLKQLHSLDDTSNIIVDYQLLHKKKLPLDQMLAIYCSNSHTEVIGINNNALAFIKINNNDGNFNIIQKILLYPHSGHSKSVAYANGTLASCDNQGILTIGYILPDGNYILLQKASMNDDKINHLVWSKHSILSCAHNSGIISLWQAAPENTYHCTHSIQAHNGSILHLAWKDTTTFASAGGTDKSIKIWQCKDNEWECLQTLDMHNDRITHLAWNHDGTILASSSEDLSIKFWRYNPSTLQYEHSTTMYTFKNFINSMEWYENYLACGCIDNTIHIFKNNELNNTIEKISCIHNNLSDVSHLTWNTHGSALLAVSNIHKTLCVWNTYNQWSPETSYRIIANPSLPTTLAVSEKVAPHNQNKNILSRCCIIL
ncbi:hypothetical protein KG892_05455 [Vermiphilus pyriformis]|nr:MAG: hypothetical protein KG892_05455 [Vermiphilus pyriformis]